jgi:hypothetical protein
MGKRKKGGIAASGTGEVFTGSLYTLVEVYQQAAALSQIDGADVHVELVLGKPSAFDCSVFPHCGGCIHFADEDLIDDGLQLKDGGNGLPKIGWKGLFVDEYGTCLRYPKRERIERDSRCGEYLGGAIFRDHILEKISG